MSTPNPTHIDVIAKAAGKVLWDADGTLNFRLNAEIAAHVVSKLREAGYSIVQPIGLEYAPCWQNEHGVHPLNSTTAWRKGAEDDVERLSADDPEIFLGVHYRTPWVAAVAEGDTNG